MKKELKLQDIRGELDYIQKLAVKTHRDGRINLDYLARQYFENHQNNRRFTKYVWHQSFSFAPGEEPENDKRIALHAVDRRMGLRPRGGIFSLSRRGSDCP